MSFLRRLSCPDFWHKLPGADSTPFRFLSPTRLITLYPTFPPAVQSSTLTHITPLIKAMAAQPTKLLAMARTFPEGADALLVRVLEVVVERNGAVPVVVEAVRGIVGARESGNGRGGARFLVPVVEGLEKVCGLTFGFIYVVTFCFDTLKSNTVRSSPLPPQTRRPPRLDGTQRRAHPRRVHEVGRCA